MWDQPRGNKRTGTFTNVNYKSKYISDISVYLCIRALQRKRNNYMYIPISLSPFTSLSPICL